MEKQFFVNELQPAFHLRNPKANKPTIVYLVCRIQGKQVKLSTGVKVYPDHWNKKRQEAYVSLKLSELDNHNNLIVNDKIGQIKTEFFEFKKYLCTNIGDIDNWLIILKSRLYKSINIMPQNNNRINATLEMKQLIDTKDVKESSKDIQKGIINLFGEFLKKQGILDSWDKITLDTLNKYQQYLMDEKKTYQTIKNHFGAINSVLKIAHKRSEIPFKLSDSGTDSFELIKNKANKEKQKDKQIALTEEQIEKIYKYSPIGNKAERDIEIKDMFVLQCLTGQRFSDMNNFLTSSYDINGEFITIEQKKTNKTAIIPLLPLAKEILLKYPNGTQHISFTHSDNTLFNRVLKRIAEEIGFTNKVIYQVHRGREIEMMEEPLYELIHTHTARHTFITIMCLYNVPKDTVKDITGHSDIKIIDEIYSHLTDRNKGDKMSQILTEKLKESTLYATKKDEIDDEIVEIIDERINSNDLDILKENRDSIIATIAGVVSMMPNKGDVKDTVSTAMDMTLSMLLEGIPSDTIGKILLNSFTELHFSYSPTFSGHTIIPNSKSDIIPKLSARNDDKK